MEFWDAYGLFGGFVFLVLPFLVFFGLLFRNWIRKEPIDSEVVFHYALAGAAAFIFVPAYTFIKFREKLRNRKEKV
jgi:hypothetical protein